MLRRALTIALSVAAILVASAGPAAAATPVERARASANAQSDLLGLINAYRASQGRQPVSPNVALTAAAVWMAGDMAAKNYVGHVSSDGRSPTQRMSAFGYPVDSMYTGEDLGAGYGTAGAVVAGWKASAAHNAVLLNPNYNAVGIGLVYNPGSTYKWYWAADFGGPGGTVKVVIPPPPPTAAERAASAPRSSAVQAAAETIDPEAQAQAARIAAVEGMARRIANLFAMLHRMGMI
ncbi:MAG: CAP domain-containing protein [Candidatus Limnocylindria bacterium]